MRSVFCRIRASYWVMLFDGAGQLGVDGLDLGLDLLDLGLPAASSRCAGRRPCAPRGWSGTPRRTCRPARPRRRPWGPRTLKTSTSSVSRRRLVLLQHVLDLDVEAERVDDALGHLRPVGLGRLGAHDLGRVGARRAGGPRLTFDSVAKVFGSSIVTRPARITPPSTPIEHDPPPPAHRQQHGPYVELFSFHCVTSLAQLGRHGARAAVGSVGAGASPSAAEVGCGGRRRRRGPGGRRRGGAGWRPRTARPAGR